MFLEDIQVILFPIDRVVPGDIGGDCLPCSMEGKGIVPLIELLMWNGSRVDVPGVLSVSSSFSARVSF
jgi:hypothetical protein